VKKWYQISSFIFLLWFHNFENKNIYEVKWLLTIRDINALLYLITQPIVSIFMTRFQENLVQCWVSQSKKFLKKYSLKILGKFCLGWTWNMFLKEKQFLKVHFSRCRQAWQQLQMGLNIFFKNISKLKIKWKTWLVS